MNTPYDTRLPPYLRTLKHEIEGYAREFGLDFYETIFEVIDAEDLNEIAAYGGFPTRYPHWSFGMSFEELKKGYDYGLSKIYEMVINNDPCYAYLMRSNHVVDQKLVMAHVYGHCLAPDTLVKTRQGDRPIDAVKAGELVLTHTGQYRRVRVVARRWYAGEICRLRLAESGRIVRITPEHPVWALRPVATASPRAQRELLAVGGKSLARNLPDFSSMPDYEETWLRAGEVRAGEVILVPVGAEDEHASGAVEAVDREDYEGFVYNFSVEQDESYTLTAGLTVHNCDFFKNNAYFGHTNRKMMDVMANHGARIRSYVEKFGEDEVETFMDRCMSIDDLIDVHSVAIRRREPQSRYDFTPDDKQDGGQAMRFKSKDYMDEYINPPDVLKAEEDQRRKQQDQAARNFPEQPEKDVLLFLIEHAPLKNWQRDVLSIIRDEAYYFAPQGMTKVINEGWACVHADTFVYTDTGLRRMGEVVDHRLDVRVSDGQAPRKVYDRAIFRDRETITVRTRRGLELTGSVTHRLLLPDGGWKRLDELAVGDRVCIDGGSQLWAAEYVRLDWAARPSLTLAAVAAEAGVDGETVIRSRRGVRSRTSSRLAEPVLRYEEDLVRRGRAATRHRTIRVPDVVDERLAAFLGYLIGDGHISVVKRTIGLTTGDGPQAKHLAALVEDVFGISPRTRWDATRWRIGFSSQDVRDFLVHLGLKTGPCAREKTVPDVILRSPKSAVAAFLRALYDCDGHAGKAGVILATCSTEMSKTVQQLLLNFGILSTRRPHKDGCWKVQAQGQSAARFADEIGFGLPRKQTALRAYVQDQRRFEKERWADRIVSIEHGRADVYDISVETTHRYAAAGFINHNSYWHSTIMTQKALSPSELVDYADHHSGTMAMSRTRLNPYKLGIELLRDIEMRWNTGRFGKEYDECDDLEKKRTWDRQLGLGRQKIFEARRVHNDITFIDTFLTPEFCIQHNLFSFAYQEQAGQYYIESRDFEKIKQRLLFGLTNFGKPWIYVVDGNFRNRGELLLKHQFSGVELRLDQAADTLANIQFVWTRPVHLTTLVDGKPTTLSFDGTDHSIRSGGETDDNRRNTPGKTR